MTDQVELYRLDVSGLTEYYDLYLKQISVDFTFTCANNELVKAHSIILMASSSFFYEEFKTNRETLNCVLPHVSAGAIKGFLELVYKKKVNGTLDAMKEVMDLADMFCVEYQEIVGEQIGPDNHEMSLKMESTSEMKIVDEPLSSKSNTITTEMQCKDNVERDTSFKQDLTFIDTSDISEIIDVCEEHAENINNNDVINDTPPSNHNADQEFYQNTTEDNYNHCLRTMNFTRLSSSCILCRNFFPDIKNHLRKKHEWPRTPKWHCGKCKNSFFWLKKKFHVCK